MYNNQRFIAIIPARGGSKGLPNKNILPLAGKPLITYTIEAAIESGVFDEVMVTTDSQAIAEVSRMAGASVPFLRPANLATDDAGSVEVICHALEHYEQEGKQFDYLVLLQPTSPLRTAGDIKGAVKLLFDKSAAAVTSVCEAEHSPKWTGIISEDLSLKDFLDPETLNLPRQKIGKYYRLNGAVYICKTDALRRQNNLFAEPAFAYVMPQAQSVDIDSLLDFKFAEFLVREKILNTGLVAE